MSYEFKLPGQTVLGENALDASEKDMRRMGQKALVVTGKIITSSGILGLLTERLSRWGIGYEVFNDITGEPTDTMVEAGVRAYRTAGCDFLIGLGGGSPLDAAKAIGAMAVLKGSVSDYLNAELSGDFPPMVLIPTTAGTGSEATKFTVITDTKKDVKMLLKGDALLPDLAIIDPILAISAPPSVTAATGMDALTHAVEAYTSRKANPLTDLFALDAVKRIFTYLPMAFKDGGNRRAREEMSVAAYEAGICISNSSVTLVHGMSRPIGALFHVPHGMSNAMLITDCLEYVIDGCYERFAVLARAIGAAEDKTDDETAARAFIASLSYLCLRLEIPSLKRYGIEGEAFLEAIPKMAVDALASGSPSNTRKELAKEDLVGIYYKLWSIT